MVLLNTGMRVSEFCSLTKPDVDFYNRRIRVDHQLVRERGGKYYVEKTKTEQYPLYPYDGRSVPVPAEHHCKSKKAQDRDDY